MFNVSHRSKAPLKDRVSKIKSILSGCQHCGSNAVPGRYVEPLSALIVDMAPTGEESKLLAALPEKRFAAIDALFAPLGLDLAKFSYTYLKKFSEPCPEHLSMEIEHLDPVLVVVWGEDLSAAIAGRPLEAGRPYVTGAQDQYLYLPTVHPRNVAKSREQFIPTWKSQMSTLAELATQYALDVFR